MDRKELVESSSSQNVNISIASLQKRGSGKETVTVSLSDGSSFFMPIHSLEGWDIGKILSEEESLFLQEEDAYVRGKEWAASRLAQREDSSGRMNIKLQKKGYSSATSRRIVEDLAQLGFLDDRRFSELWLRERLKSHPEGRDALAAGLMQRGVPSSIAQEQIARHVEPHDLDEALKNCIIKLKRQKTLTEDKIISRLLRRGFSYSAIKKELARDRE